MNLKDLRKDWEKGLTAMAESRPDNTTLLVVLKGKKGKYHCHRYFFFMPAEATKGEDFEKFENWNVSVDARDVTADTAIKWCLDPKAIPKGEECESCRGYGHFDRETGEPTIDKRGRQCTDCHGDGVIE